MKLLAGNRRRRTTRPSQQVSIDFCPQRVRIVCVCWAMRKIMSKFNRSGKISVEKSKSSKPSLSPWCWPLKIQTCHWDRMRVCRLCTCVHESILLSQPSDSKSRRRHSGASSPAPVTAIGCGPLVVGCWAFGHGGEGACQLQWGFGFGQAISLDKCAAGSLV